MSEPTARKAMDEYSRNVEESEVSVLLGRMAMGEDVGVNGYTTAAEADRLASFLDLSREAIVLDLGSGRGWPGTRVAQRSGCRVVLTDLTVEPLRQSRRYAETRGVSARVTAICANGTALPFPPGIFDAITHTDVLC